MATRQNTKNAIPSNALADLSDNTIILDEWTNGSADYTTDRFGNKFKTRKKILADLQTSVDNIQKGSFLPLSGGKVTGDVNVTGSLQKNGVNVFTIGGGTVSGNTNFMGGLQSSGTDVVKKGDAGLFLTSNSLVNITSQQDLINLQTGAIIFCRDATGTILPGISYFHLQKTGIRTGTGGGSYVAHEFASNSVFFGFNLTSDSAIEWTKAITTANVASYAGKSVVTETYLSADGLSWYRKYNDGWIEQGGVKEGSFNNSSAHSLLTKFSNTNYTIVLNALANSNANSVTIAAFNKTGSTFLAEASRSGSYNYTYTTLTWYACGY